MPASNQPLRSHLINPAWLAWPALALLATLLSRNTDIDMTLTRLFFDPQTGTFPLRHAWLWSTVLHDGLRELSAMAWLSLLIVTLSAWQRSRMDLYQPMRYTLLASAAVLLMNGLLRNMSAHSCPWALSGLGGDADYFRLLAPVPAHPGPGHCLPSGHAASAFMWWPAVHACQRWRPQTALPATLLIILLGSLCGLTQIARGAHFLSHILIAAAVCGGTASLIHYLPALVRQPTTRASIREKTDT